MTTILNWTYDENNRYHRWFRTTVIAITSLVCFVFAWWDVSLLLNSTAIPTPLETWNALVDLVVNGDSVTGGRTVWAYIASSLRTFLLGFLLALVVAVPLGLVIGYSKTVREFANPVIEVMRPIAPIAWAPIFILAIDYTIGPILVVFIGIFFPVLTNVVFGVQKIDPNLMDAARTMGASPTQVFYKVMIPSAIPYLMNGVKVGLGVGWMCIVAAELYAPQLGGIGYYLSTMATNGLWPNAFAAIVVIAILGILTTGLAEYIHKVISRRMGMSNV